MQLLWPASVENVPEGQSEQLLPPSTLNLPATHVLLQTCSSLTALPRNFPKGHVLSVHGELSVFTEYLPLPQGAHDASVVAVPAATPDPVSHGGLECTTHASVPSLLEKNPAPHAVQAESSADADPSVYPIPALHLRTVFTLHAVVSPIERYWPAAHGTHAESSADVVPA